MAEEKILKDEALNDEELEEVVGGYYDTWNDRVNFIKLGGGFYKGDNPNGSYSKTEVQNAFKKVGDHLGIKISADLHYDDTPGKSPNRYYLDGKQISRDELWSIINEGFAANK